MSPRTQTVVGTALILLALAVVWLQAVKHISDVLPLLAVFLGALGGQMFGQAYKRSSR